MKKTILVSVLMSSLLLITACGTSSGSEESIEKTIMEEGKNGNEIAQADLEVGVGDDITEETSTIGQYVLAPLGLAKGVGLYDYVNNEIVWEKIHGSNNHGIAYSNGKIYLPNVDEKRIEILNLKDGTKKAVLVTDATTHHASQSEKMNEVYVTSNDGKILIINTTNDIITDKLSVKGDPYLVLADEENNYIYVTSRNPDVLEVFSLDTKELIKDFPLQSKPSHININNSIVAVTNAGANSVSLIDVSSLEMLNTYKVGNGPHGVGINSTHILVANSMDNTLTLIDRKSEESKQISVSIMPNHINVKDDQFIITDEEGPGFYQLNLNNEELEILIKTNGPAHQFVLLNVDNKELIQSESELENIEDLGEEDHEAHHGG